MNLLEVIENRALAGGFMDIWLDEDKDGAFALCNKIREATDCPAYTREKFDEGYRFRPIFCDNEEDALNEFVNLVFGWW